jgi:hypothetical protein
MLGFHFFTIFAFNLNIECFNEKSRIYIKIILFSASINVVIACSVTIKRDGHGAHVILYLYHLFIGISTKIVQFIENNSLQTINVT